MVAGVELRLLGVEVSGKLLVDLIPHSPSSEDFSGVKSVEGWGGFRHFLMGEASETSESDLSRFDFKSSIYFSRNFGFSDEVFVSFSAVISTSVTGFSLVLPNIFQ